MTEQEAEALAARLWRVWVRVEKKEPLGMVARLRWIWDGMEDPTLVRIKSSDQFCRWAKKTQWCFDPDPFRFITCSAQGQHLSVYQEPGFSGLNFVFTPRNRRGKDHLIFVGALHPNRLLVYKPSFGEKWLPFFRRNCWLSGCAVEVNIHEKMEWIQGFTREELEAWNLNF